MSDVKIEEVTKKDVKLSAGDFVFFASDGGKYVGMLHHPNSNPALALRVIWTNGADSLYDHNMHIPFVGVLTVK